MALDLQRVNGLPNMPGKVLLIEPAITNRILLRAGLAGSHYCVDFAVDPDAARQMIDENEYDLIMLAGDLGPSSGHDFCRLLKSDPATVRIPVIMTVDGWDGSGEAAFAAGADDIVIQPIDQHALVARTRSLIRMKLMQDELDLRDDTARDFMLREDALAEDEAPFDGPPTSVVIAGQTLADGNAWADIARAANLGDVAVAKDTEALLHLCATGKVDLIVLHWSLPGSEGLRLIADLRANLATRNTAILFVAGPEESAVAGFALDLGANDYFVTPVHQGEFTARIRTLLHRKRMADRLRADLRDGLRMAVTDPLTKLYNRAYAEKHLPKMIARSHSVGEPFALLLLDLDDFKDINDAYGHAVGDAVLRETAGWLRSSVRSIDLVARYGGEEFLIAMPNADSDIAARIAERIRRNVPRAACALPRRSARKITISVGVAIASDHMVEPVGNLITRADIALYDSKAAGRDRVSFSTAA